MGSASKHQKSGNGPGNEAIILYPASSKILYYYYYYYIPQSMITDTADFSLPLGLAFGLIFLAIVITITFTVSVVVCWRARKAKSAASFHLQQNEAYHRMINILQPSSLAEGEGTISYSYPVVDGDKTNAESSSKIVTERNKAYGSRTTLCEGEK